jgi:hypothetical protein
VDDIRLLKSSVSNKVKVKAFGGIKNLGTALQLVEAGADFLGTRSGVYIIDELKQRLQASSKMESQSLAVTMWVSPYSLTGCQAWAKPCWAPGTRRDQAVRARIKQ